MEICQTQVNTKKCIALFKESKNVLFVLDMKEIIYLLSVLLKYS